MGDKQDRSCSRARPGEIIDQILTMGEDAVLVHRSCELVLRNSCLVAKNQDSSLRALQGKEVPWPEDGRDVGRGIRDALG